MNIHAYISVHIHNYTPQAIRAHTVETERTRCSTEAALADRLFHVQRKIVGLVNDMEGIQFRFVHGFRLHEREYAYIAGIVHVWVHVRVHMNVYRCVFL